MTLVCSAMWKSDRDECRQPMRAHWLVHSRWRVHGEDAPPRPIGEQSSTTFEQVDSRDSPQLHSCGLARPETARSSKLPASRERMSDLRSPRCAANGHPTWPDQKVATVDLAPKVNRLCVSFAISSACLERINSPERRSRRRDTGDSDRADQGSGNSCTFSIYMSHCARDSRATCADDLRAQNPEIAA